MNPGTLIQTHSPTHTYIHTYKLTSTILSTQHVCACVCECECECVCVCVCVCVSHLVGCSDCDGSWLLLGTELHPFHQYFILDLSAAHTHTQTQTQTQTHRYVYVFSIYTDMCIYLDICIG